MPVRNAARSALPKDATVYPTSESEDRIEACAGGGGSGGRLGVGGGGGLGGSSSAGLGVGELGAVHEWLLHVSLDTGFEEPEHIVSATDWPSDRWQVTERDRVPPLQISEHDDQGPVTREYV